MIGASQRPSKEEDCHSCYSNAEPSTLDSSGMPVLPPVRINSYGSCEEQVQGTKPKPKSRKPHFFRHQIGSDVLDFGESPLFLSDPTSCRLMKKPSKKGFP